MQHLPWLLVHGMGAWCAALLASVVLALGVAWGWWRLAARRETHRALARLAGATTAPEAFSQGGNVLVRGRLRIEGKPCARFEDGTPAAAVAIMTRSGRVAVQARAERLLLVDPASGATLVELVGPLELR